MKKLAKIATNIWKIARIMASWIRVLSVFNGFIWENLKRRIAAIMAIVQRRASAKNIMMPLKVVGTIRFVSR
jgi:hypothetical protein